jgi:antitoxin (DNA-binding transcriptional repressor) of toxin-antitoxin stability system
MTTISVDEIVRDLAGYLGRVKAGESLVITDHDQPVAELKPIAGDPCSQDRRAITEYLKARIAAATIPPRWREDGVVEPTDQCRSSTFTLAEWLFTKYALLPSRVVASRQEGVYLEYQSPTGDRRLGIEVDNELDAVAVVSDAYQVLASAPFDDEQVEGILRVFVNGSASATGDPGTSAAE